MADRKAVIKNADMSEEMQQDAVDCATQALEKYNIEKVQLSLLLSIRYTCGLETFIPQLALVFHMNFSHLVFILASTGYCCLHKKGI